MSRTTSYGYVSPSQTDLIDSLIFFAPCAQVSCPPPLTPAEIEAAIEARGLRADREVKFMKRMHLDFTTRIPILKFFRGIISLKKSLAFG